jgi:hypothetical protein
MHLFQDVWLLNELACLIVCRKLQEHDKPTIAAAAAQPPPQKVKNVAQQQQQQQHDQAGAGLSFSRLVVDAGEPPWCNLQQTHK